MATINLLYKDSYPVNDKISIYIPTVEEVLQCEDEYYGMVSALTAMPIDLIMQLDEMGLDFTTMTEYDLFLLLFKGLQTQDSHLIFGNLDLKKFSIGVNTDTNEVVLVNQEDDIIINRAVQGKIAATLRKIHRIEKNHRKPGNQEAKEYMLERARIKAKRNRKRNVTSQLESLIVALVNTEQFKYDFESVKHLSIYQFNESVNQIVRKIDYDNRMFGVYTGNIRVKDLDPNDLNWLTQK